MLMLFKHWRNMWSDSPIWRSTGSLILSRLRVFELQ